MKLLRVTLAPDYFSLSYLTRLATFRPRVMDWLEELGPGYMTQGLPIFGTSSESAIIYVATSDNVTSANFASLKELWSQHGNGVQVTEITEVSGVDRTRDQTALDANSPNPIARFVGEIEKLLGIGAGVLLLVVVVIILLSLKPWTWRTTPG